jgi:predicted DNA-binding transcriptional regulator AlpA
MDDLFDHVRRSAEVPVPESPSKPIDDELWSVRKITAKTGLGRSTLYKYVSGGHFPRQRRLGPGRVGWLASEIRDWMATRPTSP